jgi:elongation factor Ts
MVAIETDAPRDKAEGVAKDICMHIAFSRPAALERGEISPEEIERERAIYMEEVRSKPEDMREKIILGKLEKFFAGKVLPEQPWFKDDKQTVSKVLAAALGKNAKIAGFACFVIGT